MENFTPVSAVSGGLLIGLSAAFLLLVGGRISGISGIIEGLLQPFSRDLAVRLLYILGLLLAPLVVLGIAPAYVPTPTFDTSLFLLPVSGVLVGFGARLANGCTSGHGICGLPRLSRRSIAATVTFFATAAITVMAARAFAPVVPL